MSGKKVVVSTDTTKKKQIQDNPDGSTVTTITTTTVEKYSDGTQSTKTQVETHKTTPERKEKDSESPPGPPGSLVEAAKQSGNQPPDPLGIQSQSEGSKGLGKTEQSFLDGALKATNELRAKHSSPPLVLDVELCNLAQVWTDKLAGQQKMEHSTTEYGENCYWSSLNLTDGRRPVESWYSVRLLK